MFLQIDLQKFVFKKEMELNSTLSIIYLFVTHLNVHSQVEQNIKISFIRCNLKKLLLLNTESDLRRQADIIKYN